MRVYVWNAETTASYEAACDDNPVRDQSYEDFAAPVFYGIEATLEAAIAQGKAEIEEQMAEWAGDDEDFNVEGTWGEATTSGDRTLVSYLDAQGQVLAVVVVTSTLVGKLVDSTGHAY